MSLRVVAANLVVLLVPAALGAQVCLGKPSLTNAPVNFGGAVDFVEGARGYGGEVVFGSRAFLAGTFSYTDFDTAGQSLKALGATLAYDVPNDDASMCIAVTGSYGFGLEEAAADITTLGIGPVLAVGVETEMSSAVSLIEFGQFGWFWERTTADAGQLGTAKVTSDYGALVLGVSLVFGQTLAIGPAVTFPVGLESSDKTFTLALTLAVPRAG